MCVQTSKFAISLSQIQRIRVILTQLKLWVAVARHNFNFNKVGENENYLFSALRVIAMYINFMFVIL